MLLSLKLPPGVYRNGTEYDAAGRWFDCHLVRFADRTVRPVGGWQLRSPNAVTGKARAILTWRDNGGNRNIAVGTHSGLFRMNEAGTVADITPADLAPGDPDASVKTGYGTGLYGLYAYGTPRPDLGVYAEATVWTLDTWGEYLVGVSSKDGRLVEWRGDSTVAAAPITGAPTANRALVVTEERFLLALGAGGNPRRVQWSDFQNNKSWTPTALNQAGDEELQTPGQLMQGVRVAGVVLLLTDVDAHVARYVGYPAVYGFERIGTGCGAISQHAAAVIDQFAVWMGRDGFHLYDGLTRRLECDVADHVFGRLSDPQRSKVHAFTLSSHSEVWWLYPSNAGNEIDSYVAWNYRENHWTVGRIGGSVGRTCGAGKGTFANPLMVGSDGRIYEHETGLNYDGELPFVETGPIEIGDGRRVMQALQLIPDEATQGDVSVTLKARPYPNGPETTAGPYTMKNPVPVRISGRQIKVRFTGARLADWRIGRPRLELQGRGKR